MKTVISITSVVVLAFTSTVSAASKLSFTAPPQRPSNIMEHEHADNSIELIRNIIRNAGTTAAIRQMRTALDALAKDVERKTILKKYQLLQES